MTTINKIALTLFERKKELYSELDPFYGILRKCKDVGNLFLKKINKIDFIAIFYFGMSIIHSILYDLDDIITIIFEDMTQTCLAYIFYLNLLINDDSDVVNYKYSIDYIKILNDEQKKIKDKYILFIKAKIIIDLITNFRNTDEYYQDEHDELLKEFEYENKKIMEENKNALNNFNIILDENKTIDEIYNEIIISLIKQRKFEDYENTLNIIKQLELENIYLTKTICQGLTQLFTSNEEYINERFDGATYF